MAIPTCPEEGLWPETNIDTLREISGGVGVLGNQTRYCNHDQTWGPVQDDSCGMR